MNRHGFLERATESSILLPAVRRLTHGSHACAVIAAFLRPSLAYLGHSDAAETDGRSVDALMRMWNVTADSMLARTLLRGVDTIWLAWRHAAASRQRARLLDRIHVLEPSERIRLLGWVLLVGALTAGVVRGLIDEAWPRLSVLIWAVTITGALGLIAGACKITAAWEEYRAPRDGRRF